MERAPLRRPMMFRRLASASSRSGAALAAVTDADGIARVECCIHPWMRTEVRVK